MFFVIVVENVDVAFAGAIGPGARPVAPREVHELRHRVAGHGRPQQPLVQEHQGLQAPQQYHSHSSTDFFTIK